MRKLINVFAALRGRLWDTFGTALLALVLSLVVWVNAVYQDDAPRQDYFPQAIPIEVLNTGEGLIVTNAPSQEVNVQIKAFQSSWSSLTAESFRATVDLTDRDITVVIDLHAGSATSTVWTNDLTAAYVHENSAYSS